MKKAMIWAAGLGTRLSPLTYATPKALVTINETTLLDLTIRRLVRFGFQDIIVNVHHFGDQIISYVKKYKSSDFKVTISDERDQLLNTGGGLKKARPFFDGNPFLVVNVDNITDLDLQKFYADHCASGAIATLAVRHRETSRYLLFDEENRLCGWENRKTGEQIIPCPSENLRPLAFSSLQVLDPAIFNYMPDKEVFSIIEFYLSLCKSEKIIGYQHDETLWMDVGTPAALSQAATCLRENPDLI